MIDAYIDESGIHDGAPACVVAGYFGGRGQWRKTERDWRRVLNKFHVPVPEFHAVNLVKRRKFFHGWSSDESLELQLALAEVVTQYKVYPVAKCVLTPDYKRMTQAEQKFLTGATLRPDGHIRQHGNVSQPYFAPFQQVIRTVLGHTTLGGKAHFFFGIDEASQGYARSLFEELKNNPDHDYSERMGTIAFPQAKDTPAMQVADLLSYLTYQQMLEGARTMNLRTVPPVMRALISRRREARDLSFQDENLLRQTIRMIPIEQRGELLEDEDR
jgi:hypothetical protein